MSNSMTPMRIVQAMSQSLCIILLLTAFAFSAESQEKRVRNIVLVHGAWADGSGWKGVYDILVKDQRQPFKRARNVLQETSPLRSVSSINKMDRAFLSLTAMGEP